MFVFYFDVLFVVLMDILLILVFSEGVCIDDYWIIGDGCIKISWYLIFEECSNGVI